MSVEIKDYLHLYLGCDVLLCKNLEGNNVIEQLNGRMLWEDMEMFEGEYSYKPILRKLSDMTEEEDNQFTSLAAKCDYEVLFGYNNKKKLIGITWEELGATGLFFNTAAGVDFLEIFRWLLSKNFDLFGLIESGLAIDKTKI
ncbi:MAG: hypothetical protein JWO92_2522 [Chitinophagaceae bacterium]|nr:hypothetical protein [Chitinophagaceae bacterium]